MNSTVQLLMLVHQHYGLKGQAEDLRWHCDTEWHTGLPLFAHVVDGEQMLL